MANLRREDFKEEGEHRWVAYKQGYAIIVSKIDGAYEVSIKSKLLHNPTDEDWVLALVRIADFFKKLRVADWYTGGGEDNPEENIES